METYRILYDEDCSFCRWALRKLLAWDRPKRLQPVALQSADADALLGDMDHETRMRSWHLVSPDCDVFSAGAAVAPLMRVLPMGAPVALVADTFPRATQRMYEFVARNRSLLARLGARS